MINTVVFEGRFIRKNNFQVFHNARTGRDNPSILFTMAVPRNFKDRNGQRQSDFFNCRAMGSTANFLNRYVGIGDTIVVSGEMHNDNYRSNRYRDSQGQPAMMRSVQLTVFNADLAGRSRRNQAAGMGMPHQQGQMNGPHRPMPNNNRNNHAPLTNNQNNGANKMNAVNNRGFNPYAHNNNAGNNKPAPKNNNKPDYSKDPFNNNKGINISSKDLPF